MEGLIPPAIAFAVLFGIVGLIFLYQKVSRNGHALREHELPKEIFEIVTRGALHNGDTVLVLLNAKKEVLSCCIQSFKLFSIEGRHDSGYFLVPKKVSEKLPSELPTIEFS